ncbi:hypothetical protein SAMN05428941_6102 [Streptomyces sp. 2114.2]|nr:hypothetical protein BX268_6114 [Streptomyces sp. 2221.1]SDT77449.1 hypothetical protein SAMN05428941_6102 [Streptomyces sp. 2114.2]
MKGKGNSSRRKDSVIVVAGEGDFDRKVLWHLIRAFRPDTKIVNIKDKTSLREADKELTPRIDRLRKLAQAASVRSELAGIVVHVDLDLVNAEEYEKVRRRISAELRKNFACPSAVALAAFEMEAWLMQFPAAFAKVNNGWILKAKYQKGCDLTKIHKPKERLKEHAWTPPYLESDAPRIMEKAFGKDGKLMQPDGKNRSYEEFITELAGW